MAAVPFFMISSCCERSEPNVGMGSGIPLKRAWRRIAPAIWLPRRILLLLFRPRIVLCILPTAPIQRPLSVHSMFTQCTSNGLYKYIMYIDCSPNVHSVNNENTPCPTGIRICPSRASLWDYIIPDLVPVVSQRG